MVHMKYETSYIDKRNCDSRLTSLTEAGVYVFVFYSDKHEVSNIENNSRTKNLPVRLRHEE